MTRTHHDIIRVDAVLPMAQSEVWNLITDPFHFSQWFGELMLFDARPGGSFQEVRLRCGQPVVTRGQITRFEPKHTLTMTWAEETWEHSTVVDIRVEHEGAGARLWISHAGWAPLCKGGTTEIRDHHEAFWKGVVTKLAAYCEKLEADAIFA